MPVRLITLFALMFMLVGCSDQLVANATAVAPPSSQPVAQATLQPTAAVPAPGATTPPTQPPTVIPTVTPSVTKTAPATPTLKSATPTAIAASTATPALAEAETPAQVAQHVFPIRSDGKVSYGRAHHDYPATDMFCPIGSVFVAVTDGVVDFVSSQDLWDPKINDGATRGGLSVAIVGDDGVRYYGSHLSQIADGIAPGLRVVAGQQLGLTGKSGDARFTDAHLHFGISHPTTPDDWEVRRGEISPYSYLRAWQRGEDATPSVQK